MPLDISKLKANDEVLVELQGSKRFYGTISVINPDAILMKNVRQVENGLEKKLGEAEKIIKFPFILLVSVTPQVQEIVEVL